VEKTLQPLEEALPEYLARLRLPSNPAGLRAAKNHELMMLGLSLGNYAEVSRIGLELISEFPEFVPALNNLSDCVFQQGDLALAIDYSKKALAVRPDNIHTLANLCRYLFLTGDLESARVYADRMLASPAEASQRALKIVHTLALLGDDAKILEVVEKERQPRQKDPKGYALALRFGAVACMRLGDSKRAQALWKEYLELHPEDSRARQMRNGHAPSFLEAGAFCPIEELQKLAEAHDASAEASSSTLRIHLATVLPAMLDRGDEGAVELALSFVEHLSDASIREAARRFSVMNRGTQKQRLRAARFAHDSRNVDPLKPPGLQVWTDGKLEDVKLLEFEVHGESNQVLSGKVEELATRAFALSQQRKWKKAIPLLREAIRLQPDEPSLRNNLAAALIGSGQRAEAEALVMEIETRWPDYFFGRISAAHRAMGKGELKKAEQILESLSGQRRLHFTEMSALGLAQIRLFHEMEDASSAEVWLDLLKSTVPSDPQIPALSAMVEALSKRTLSSSRLSAAQLSSGLIGRRDFVSKQARFSRARFDHGR
jgi:tetratricopeptide (TPR) repeat protein